MPPSPQQKPCSKCHAPLQPTVRFCTNCGTAVKSRKSLQERLQGVKQVGQRVQGWISRLPWSRLRQLPQAVRNRLPNQPHWLAQYSARSKVAGLICTGLLLRVMVWDLSSQGGTDPQPPIDPVEVAAAAKLPTVTKLIGAKGGTIELNGFKMEIPKGALNHEIAFTVVQTANADNYTPPPGSIASMKQLSIPVSGEFHISPSIEFEQQVKVTFPINKNARTNQAVSRIGTPFRFSTGRTLPAAISPILPTILLAQQSTTDYTYSPAPNLEREWRLFTNGNPISPRLTRFRLIESDAQTTYPALSMSVTGRLGGRYSVNYTNYGGSGFSQKHFLGVLRDPVPIEVRFDRALNRYWSRKNGYATSENVLTTVADEMAQIAEDARTDADLRRVKTPFQPLRLRALFWEARINEHLFRQNPQRRKAYKSALVAYRDILREYRYDTDSHASRASYLDELVTGRKAAGVAASNSEGAGWLFLTSTVSETVPLYDPLDVKTIALDRLNTICPFGPEVFLYLDEAFNSEDGHRPSSFFDGISPELLFIGGNNKQTGFERVKSKTLSKLGHGQYQQSVDAYVGGERIEDFAKEYPLRITLPALSVARAYDPDTVSIQVTRTVVSPDFVNRGKPVDYAFDVPYKILLGKLGGPFDLAGDLLFDYVIDLAHVYNTDGTWNLPIYFATNGRKALKLVRWKSTVKRKTAPSGRVYEEVERSLKGNIADLYSKPAKFNAKDVAKGAIPYFRKDFKDAGKLRKWIETAVVPTFETAVAARDAGKRLKFTPSPQKWYDKEFLAAVLNNYKFKQHPLNQIGTNYLTNYTYLKNNKRNPIPLIEVTVEGVPSRLLRQIDQFPIKATHVFAFHLNLGKSGYFPKLDGQDQFGGRLDDHWRMLGNGPISKAQLATPGAGVLFKVTGLPGEGSKLLGADDKGDVQRWKSRVNAQNKIEIKIKSAYGKSVTSREFFTNDKLPQQHRLAGTASNTRFMHHYARLGLQEPGVMAIPVVPRVIKELDTGEDPLITAAVQSGLSLPKKFYVNVKIKDDEGEVVHEKDFRINLEKRTGAKFSSVGDLLCATVDAKSEIDWEKVVRKFSLAHGWPDPDEPDVQKREKAGFDFAIERFQQGKEPARPVNYHSGNAGKGKRRIRYASGAIIVEIYEKEAEAIAMDEHWMKEYKSWPSTWPDTHRYHEFRPQNTPFEVRVASSISSSVHKTTSGHASVRFQIGKACILLSCGADWLRKEDRSARTAARNFIKKASDEWVMEVLKLAETCRK